MKRKCICILLNPGASQSQTTNQRRHFLADSANGQGNFAKYKMSYSITETDILPLCKEHIKKYVVFVIFQVYLPLIAPYKVIRK